MPDFRGALWLESHEREYLRSEIANILDSKTAPSDNLIVLQAIVTELGVARSRYESGPIPATGLRNALGKGEDSIPVRVSRLEAMTILTTIKTIPISLAENIMSTI